MLAPQATLGLGRAAGISLQSSFDQVVAATHGLMEGLRAAVGSLREVMIRHRHRGRGWGLRGFKGLGRVLRLGLPDLAHAKTQALIEIPTIAAPFLVLLRCCLTHMIACWPQVGAEGCMVAPLEGLLEGVGGQLVEWDRLVKTQHGPSRVLQWAGTE